MGCGNSKVRRPFVTFNGDTSYKILYNEKTIDLKVQLDKNDMPVCVFLWNYPIILGEVSTFQIWNDYWHELIHFSVNGNIIKNLIISQVHASDLVSCLQDFFNGLLMDRLLGNKFNGYKTLETLTKKLDHVSNIDPPLSLKKEDPIEEIPAAPLVKSVNKKDN